MKLGNLPTNWSGRGGNRRWRTATTFVEVMAAMVFMAIVIPVAMQGLHIANRAGVVAQRKGVAVRLAERQLNELIITDNWRTVSPRGSFGRDWPDYNWQVRQRTWTEGTLRELTVVVTYRVQNKDYDVQLTTLVKDTN